MKKIVVRTIRVNDHVWRWEIWLGKKLLKQSLAKSHELACYAAGMGTVELMEAGKLRIGEFEAELDLDCPF